MEHTKSQSAYVSPAKKENRIKGKCRILSNFLVKSLPASSFSTSPNPSQRLKKGNDIYYIGRQAQ